MEGKDQFTQARTEAQEISRTPMGRYHNEARILPNVNDAPEFHWTRENLGHVSLKEWAGHGDPSIRWNTSGQKLLFVPTSDMYV